ncbi:MAG: SUF system NifU family Fe-S cluster assembly protein [Actinomycetia bacterium]|nr:SUF system NifU family Fe-S cluster assembly protein [Actinomycetes bacterium]MCP4223281.1 SUF system NifU family Fe-S cluster assembly protein [Actinomycetes bacterium]MCP5032378.1 SUF system NifU family Fe-S cluster assembly protein [Actinomycetes bacterium]
MSGLEDLYREIILDHYRSPRNRGELESPPAHRAEGFNPLCGDEVVVYLELGDDGTIQDIKIGGQGCSISQSSASMMSAAVRGKTIQEAKELTGAFKAMMSIHETDIGGDGTSAQPPEAESLDKATNEHPLGDLEALRGVVKFPVRIKCATLSWNTLNQAFDEIAAGPS